MRRWLAQHAVSLKRCLTENYDANSSVKLYKKLFLFSSIGILTLIIGESIIKMKKIYALASCSRGKGVL